MMKKTLACIDIGTNTFRLLIADVNESGLKELYSERIATRLGTGLSNNNLLSNAAMAHGIAALIRFRKALSGFKVDMVTAAGTSALREAKNSDVFLKETKEKTGFDIKIISEKEEALTTSLGMTGPFSLTIERT